MMRSMILICMLAKRAARASSDSPAEATTTGMVVDMQWRGELRKLGEWPTNRSQYRYLKILVLVYETAISGC